MAHVGFGADPGASGNVIVPLGVTLDLLNWEPMAKEPYDGSRKPLGPAYDEQARVTCSHSRNGTVASLGCRFDIYRVLGSEEILVFAVPLADNIAERLIAGPYDMIRVRVVQLGLAGAAGDSASAAVIARLEGSQCGI